MQKYVPHLRKHLPSDEEAEEAANLGQAKADCGTSNSSIKNLMSGPAPVYDPATNPIVPGQGTYPSVVVNKMIRSFQESCRLDWPSAAATFLRVWRSIFNVTGSCLRVCKSASSHFLTIWTCASPGCQLSWCELFWAEQH